MNKISFLLHYLWESIPMVLASIFMMKLVDSLTIQISVRGRIWSRIAVKKSVYSVVVIVKLIVMGSYGAIVNKWLHNRQNVFIFLFEWTKIEIIGPNKYLIPKFSHQNSKFFIMIAVGEVITQFLFVFIFRTS